MDQHWIDVADFCSYCAQMDALNEALAISTSLGAEHRRHRRRSRVHRIVGPPARRRLSQGSPTWSPRWPRSSRRRNDRLEKPRRTSHGNTRTRSRENVARAQRPRPDLLQIEFEERPTGNWRRLVYSGSNGRTPPPRPRAGRRGTNQNLRLRHRNAQRHGGLFCVRARQPTRSTSDMLNASATANVALS